MACAHDRNASGIVISPWVLPVGIGRAELRDYRRHEQLRDRSGMSDIEPDKFRREAEECRRNAEQARNPIDREAWLRLAEDWMELVRRADPTRGSKSPS
jgi:uncharacterized alpha-E superfamily protein